MQEMVFGWDGEYGGVFTRTYEQGNYEFTFRASAVSRDGEPVTREAVRSKFVEGNDRIEPKCCKPIESK